MPIATPQGTLDFKSVDKVTFVGVSSNTVIDTTTGSLGVGVDVNGPTSNLHVVGNTRLEGDINMLHTANTASIKLNSNVVTEFPRSKKLIKYPRVALGTNGSPSSGTGGGYTLSGYTVKASDEFGGGTTYSASKVFTNTNLNYEDTWISVNPSYTSADGLPIANSATVVKFGQNGSWIEVGLPNAIQLYSVHITGRHTHFTERIDTADVWASNTGNDGDWVKLTTIDFNDTYTDVIPMVAEIDTQTYYRYFAIQITKLGWSGTYANIGEWELFGIPEYDPDADGVDVKVKSVPNVPNTDWLEVYYDAKDLGDGVVTSVDDLTPNGTNDGTPYGGVTVSDGSFVLDGTNDYITTPALGFSGDQAHSVSLWFWSDKPQSDMTTEHGLYCIGRAVNPLDGTNSARSGLSFWDPATYPNSPLRYWHSGSNGKNFRHARIVQNTWNHVLVVYPGGGAFNIRIWLNGVEQRGTDGGSTNNDFAWNTGDHIIIGDWYTGTGAVMGQSPWDGKIANFRLFNRPLTQDEIHQLYTHQKEYFGHGDLSMTLKAGRLGIGTSEPRTALDVRGRITREYNPGEIIEELTTVCNGRPVTVLSGTYIPDNVTSFQTSSATHTEINGSNITYNKPAGTKRIYYKFACQWDDASYGAITNFKIRVYHNGAWRDINPSRYTHAAQYQSDGNHHGQAWVVNEYIFECDAETESQHDGRFLSSKTSYTFDVTWRQHGASSYTSVLHMNQWWDGSGTDILHPPQLTIRAIA